MNEKLLEIKQLKTYFDTRKGTVKAVNDVSFDISAGETVGIVGESGCGKSVTALSILKLVNGRTAGGEILFEGKDILRMSTKEILDLRGNDISMIFQEPMTSLNPVHRVGEQIAEAIVTHRNTSKKEALKIAVEMLDKVGVPDPERRVYDFPHQLSGGMRQRVMIAMALCCNPKLLIADEPTTALDVTIQAQIIELLKKIKEERKMAIMLITHSLGVVASIAQRVIVMYAGVVVEDSPVNDIFEKPLHPYTKGLLEAIPKLDTSNEDLYIIRGSVPNPLNMPKGCKFGPRCSFCKDICEKQEPPLLRLEDRRFVRCWLHDKEAE